LQELSDGEAGEEEDDPNESSLHPPLRVRPARHPCGDTGERVACVLHTVHLAVNVMGSIVMHMVVHNHNQYVFCSCFKLTHIHGTIRSRMVESMVHQRIHFFWWWTNWLVKNTVNHWNVLDSKETIEPGDPLLCLPLNTTNIQFMCRGPLIALPNCKPEDGQLKEIYFHLTMARQQDSSVPLTINLIYNELLPSCKINLLIEYQVCVASLEPSYTC
jgi:hypothetical protein